MMKQRFDVFGHNSKKHVLRSYCEALKHKNIILTGKYDSGSILPMPQKQKQVSL